MRLLFAHSGIFRDDCAEERRALIPEIQIIVRDLPSAATLGYKKPIDDRFFVA